jgi:GH24 family phage-related lysozyme (muramidase)
MLSGLRDIIIPWEDALEVFNESTLPIYIEQTLDAFPNSENLPPDAFGALVSLVFNRGPLVDSSDRRKEMRAIRSILLEGDDDIVDEDDIRRIAAEVRKMARLWPDNKNSDGDLHDRRIAESELILSSI